MDPQKDLPLPQTDLPLPEKEIPAGSEAKPIAKNKWAMFILVALLLLLGTVTGGYFLGVNNKPKEVACTLEAKLCPDGSSVGRTGPKCEFTKCPENAQNETASWKTYNNTEYNYALKIPQNWSVSAKGDSDPNTFIAPFFDSPCVYAAGDLCSQFYIGAYDTNGDLEPTFIIDSSFDKIQSKTKTKFYDEDASEIIYTQGNQGSGSDKLFYVLIFNHNNNKFEIRYEESQKGNVFSKSSDWKNKKLFDQILSTLKFTDQTTTVPQELKDKIIKDLKSDSSPGYDFTVGIVIGNYARGNELYSLTSAPYYAAKINGKWTLIIAAHYVPQCSYFKDYENFPKEWCYNGIYQTSSTTQSQ